MSIAFWFTYNRPSTPASAVAADRQKHGTHPNVPDREFAIFCIALLWERHAKRGIEVSHHCARGREILEQEEYERELVEKIDTQDQPPEDCAWYVNDCADVGKYSSVVPGCGRMNGPSRNWITPKSRKPAIAAYAPL